MAIGKSKYFPLLAITIDVILLFNAFLTANYLIFGGKFPHPVFYHQLFAGWVILWVIISISLKLFDLPRILYLDKIIKKYIYGVAIFATVSSSLLFFITDYKFSRLFLITAITIFLMVMILWHIMLVILFKTYRRNGNNFRNIAIVGCKRPVEQLIKSVLLNPENGYNILGIFSDKIPEESLKKYYKGKEEVLLNQKDKYALDELFLALPGDKSELINKYIKFADDYMVRVHVLPNFSDYLFQKFSIDYIHNIPVLELRKEPLESLSNRIIKRLFDLVFSVSVLVFIGSWLFPILAIIIKSTSKGPVFFSQLRSGRDGKDFECLKFRSMTVNKDADNLQASKEDVRITGVGKFIRKTSLDELPQFFNVVLNQMSVVGPRPHMIKHTSEYKKMVDKYMVRHYAKPGITGLAQVRGFRGEIKNIADIKNRSESDIWYIENWSFLLDIKIIIRTVWQVVFTKEKNAF